MRDRLIELCGNVIESCKSNLCAGCEHNNIDYPNCMGVHFADYLLTNGVIVPPCKVGDKINGEVVCEMLYSETLGFEGNIHRNKQAYTCDKADIEKKIRVEHPMTWEKAEQALKGGVE